MSRLDGDNIPHNMTSNDDVVQGVLGLCRCQKGDPRVDTAILADHGAKDLGDLTTATIVIADLQFCFHGTNLVQVVQDDH